MQVQDGLIDEDGVLQKQNKEDAPDTSTPQGLLLYHSIVDKHLTSYMTTVTAGSRFKLDVTATAFCVKEVIALGEVYAERQEVKATASDEDWDEDQLQRGLAEHAWPCWWPAGWAEEIAADRNKQPNIDAYTVSD